jgi:hypothetical protein
MITQTFAATTKDWLEGSERVKIAAYVQNYVTTVAALELPALAPIIDENLLDTLAKTGMTLRLERRPPDIQTELEFEFQAWDSLSDEAFIDFEQKLG